MEGGAERLGRRDYAGGRGLYRGTLVSRRSVRFVACAYCRRDPCAIEDFRSSAHCAPTRQHADTKAASGIRAGKKEVCIMFMVPGGRGEHHTRAPCALAPTFSAAAAFLPFLPLLQDDPSPAAPARLLKRRCEVLGLFIWRSLLGPFELDLISAGILFI